MSKRIILTFPDKRLRTIAKPVEHFDDELKELVRDMFETMYDSRGIGLAATQINVHLRIVVMDVPEGATDENSLPEDSKPRPMVFINPEITSTFGTQIYQEGCLSVPECFAEIERAEKITIRAQDTDGNPFEMEADGLLAVCIQHELDHLQGKLFVDYLSPLKRQRFEKKLAKISKMRDK